MCSVPRHGAVYFLSIYQDRPLLVSLHGSCTRRMGETDNNKKTDEAVKNCIKCFEGKKGWKNLYDYFRKVFPILKLHNSKIPHFLTSTKREMYASEMKRNN